MSGWKTMSKQVPGKFTLPLLILSLFCGYGKPGYLFQHFLPELHHVISLFI